jgi:protein phosphatase PTC6
MPTHAFRRVRPKTRKNAFQTYNRRQAAESSPLLDAFMGYVSTFFHAPNPSLRAPARHRLFHNYFVTHLPSSSLHPDSGGPHHKLPRAASTPHTPRPGSSPALSPPNIPPNRDLTVVRIPLHSAKHHYGAANSRGQRVYNEDTHQAGTIDMPAFAKRGPISLVSSQLSRAEKSGEGTAADSAFGDPQVFYFGVFDGHGGGECSAFLRDELHGYIEEAAGEFGVRSSLRHGPGREKKRTGHAAGVADEQIDSDKTKQALEQVDIKGKEEVKGEMRVPEKNEGGISQEMPQMEALEGTKDPLSIKADVPTALKLQRELIQEYKHTVGGYFRRMCPEHFDEAACDELKTTKLRPRGSESGPASKEAPKPSGPVTVESVLSYAFLRADLDFVAAQARKPDPDDPYAGEQPLNEDEILGSPHSPPSGHRIGGKTRFKGGSTASVALISTPTPAPFWHPAANSTLLVAHVGDTRMLLCETATGLPRPLTSDHHPSSPSESRRLLRYAGSSLATDSFGEERIAGLANSRAFGDVASKFLGVSAEPELTRLELAPAQYSFLVLMSDGVSGSVSDQEVVDVVKEAKTPEQAARNVIDYACEVSQDGDNATCMVVRLGGWERRSEGGVGSLGTKEIRDIRRAEANDPRRGGGGR